MAYDAIIVLGSGINRIQTSTEISRDRVTVAAQLFFRGETRWIVVSGGVTGSLHLSEARIMSEHLQVLGIPQRAILKEEYSNTTIGNAYYTKKLILEPRNFMKVAVVTSDFHSRRALLVFRKVLGKKYVVKCIPVSHERVAKKVILKEKIIYPLHNLLLNRVKDGEEETVFKIARNLRVEK